MKKITLFLMIAFVAVSVSAQRISGLTIEGHTALTPFGAFNPTNDNADKPGDGQIVYANSVDLSNVNVTINAGADASVVEPSPLPTDWSSTVTGIKVEKDDKSAWANYDITIKKVLPAELPFEIKTGAGNFDSDSWTPTTVGWAGAAIDKAQNLIRFGSANRAFVVAFSDEPDSLYYTIKALSTEWVVSKSEFNVEGSADGVSWRTIVKYDEDNEMPGTSPAVVKAVELDEDIRFVRWIYSKRNNAPSTGKGFNVSLENILVTKGEGTGLKNYYANTVKIYPTSSNTLALESAFDVKSVRLINLVGAAVFSTDNPQEVIHINNLPQGIYVGEITLQNGHVVGKKIKL